ncbi:MAG: hypothetical protein HQK77_19280 [Desulfobacterales bacterium]|nr:hypothetical protein [Desulfobacterales bacterium]
MRWISCLVFFFFISGIADAKDNPPKILIVNSDNSVVKYTIAQDEFKTSIHYPIVDINLSDNEWDEEQFKNLLIKESPTLIYAIGSKAFLFSQKYADKNIPIVFSSIVNCMRFEMRENTYGIRREIHPGMQLSIFKYFFPSIKKIGLLYSKEYTEEWFNQTQNEAKNMDIELIGKEIEKGVGALINEKIDAFWMISEPAILSDKEFLLSIFKDCDAHKLPIFADYEALAKQGASLVVTVNDATIGKQAANIAMQLLKGLKVKNNINYPAGSYVIFNQKVVEAYGLHYSKEAVRSSDMIIKK